MLAFRNMGNSVVEIQVDVGPDNQPLLPPNTTTASRPADLEGYYHTVVGSEWVAIPITTQIPTFESNKYAKQEALANYKKWYLEQPVPVGVDNRLFDGNELARGRLTQALTVNTATGYLPAAWFDYNDEPLAITVIGDLVAIVAAVGGAFATRFTEVATLRAQIAAAADQTALDAVVVPSIPNNMFM